jgi:hypothetical protein
MRTLLRIHALSIALTIAAVPPQRIAAQSTPGPAVTGVAPLPSPAGTPSEAPSLVTGADGSVWLTWFEPRPEGGHRLLLSSWKGGRWGAPVTVARGDSFFVNWAEIAGVTPLAGGRWVAHWPWKNGRSEIAYILRLAFGGPTGPAGGPIRPHDDITRTPHGFPSLVPEGDGVRVLWLDGRFSAPRPDSAGDTQLRAAHVARNGRVTDEQVLDPRVSDCSRTAMVPVPGGVLAVYRDRAADETRDIMLVRHENGRWGTPYPLHADGWNIRGCPVNGPAADARGDRVVVGWYAVGKAGRRVQVAFSADGGRTFGAPIAVDTLGALGRPRVALLEDGSALVAWQSSGRRAATDVNVNRVYPDGRLATAVRVAASSGNASGYPQMARNGDQVIFGWTFVRPGKPRTLTLHQARIAAPPAR